MTGLLLLGLIVGCSDKSDPAVDTGTVDTEIVDADEDGHAAAVDCDDANADLGAVAADADCDGVPTAEDCDDANADLGAVAADGDCDGVTTSEDCDDADAASTTVATDGDCDGVPTLEDCDDTDGSSTTVAADGDCDGVASLEDCDDADTSLGAVANDVDCDGAVSVDDCDDADASLGAIANDGDCDGSLSFVDCNDADASVNWDAEETCDGVDNDCNGFVDAEDPSVVGASTFYGDSDVDGYGDAQFVVTDCHQPSGYVENSTDCDDLDATTHPSASEICDTKDNDCDNDIDEGVLSTWYADLDGDGSGDAGNVVEACAAPTGYQANGDDCDDTDAALNSQDQDADGYTTCDGDCNDDLNTVSPGTTELCDDGTDQNCNGLVDCEDAGCITAPMCYESDCGDGEDNDDDGLVDCTDDECAGRGDCRVMVSRVHGGTLQHVMAHRFEFSSHGKQAEGWYTNTVTTTANDPNNVFVYYYGPELYTYTGIFLSSTQSDRLLARDLWGTVKLYTQSHTLHCGWFVDTAQFSWANGYSYRLARDNSSTYWYFGPPDAYPSSSEWNLSSLVRRGFGTTGFCGLDSSFLPSVLVPQSGWALLDTSASNPWYAAAHSTLGGSLPATHLTSNQSADSSYRVWPVNWGVSGNISIYTHDWVYVGERRSVTSRSSVSASWAVASPNTVAGQPYRVEIPCGDPTVHPNNWYMDSDGDGYGDPARVVFACLAPSAYVSNGTDSDDADSSTH